MVLDDHSEDGTAELILQFASRDSRVRLVSGNTLPADWNGKQYACYQLVNAALNEHVLFLDADVQLQPSALACLMALKQRSQVALLSAFPKQLMGSPLELAVVPLMHYILLGFLPFNRMRRSTHPAYAAGCGQLFLTTKTEYQAAGTHAAIRGSRHDGIKLPKAYRAAGLSTDVVDGTRLAACRMYSGAAEVVRGVLKNADEGIANPRAIMPFSVLLLGSTLLPLLLLIGAVIGHQFHHCGNRMCCTGNGACTAFHGDARFAAAGDQCTSACSRDHSVCLLAMDRSGDVFARSQSDMENRM